MGRSIDTESRFMVAEVLEEDAGIRMIAKGLGFLLSIMKMS